MSRKSQKRKKLSWTQWKSINKHASTCFQKVGWILNSSIRPLLAALSLCIFAFGAIAGEGEEDHEAEEKWVRVIGHLSAARDEREDMGFWIYSLTYEVTSSLSHTCPAGTLVKHTFWSENKPDPTVFFPLLYNIAEPTDYTPLTFLVFQSKNFTDRKNHCCWRTYLTPGRSEKGGGSVELEDFSSVGKARQAWDR